MTIYDDLQAQITTLQSQVSTLTSQIAAKAQAADLSALSTTVTGKADHSELDSAEGTLTTKASSASLATLQTQVTNLNTLVAALQALADPAFSGNLADEITTLFDQFQLVVDHGNGTVTIGNSTTVDTYTKSGTDAQISAAVTTAESHADMAAANAQAAAETYADMAASGARSHADTVAAAAQTAAEGYADTAAANAQGAAETYADTAVGAMKWQPTTSYATNQVVEAPDGSKIVRNAAGTSRSTFDATEAVAWTSVLAKTGTSDNLALNQTSVPYAPPGYSTFKGYFDPKTGVYRPTQTVLQKARSAAAKALAKTGSFHISVIGDSQAFGTTQPGAWPSHLRDRLVSYYGSAGSGFRCPGFVNWYPELSAPLSNTTQAKGFGFFYNTSGSGASSNVISIGSSDYLDLTAPDDYDYLVVYYVANGCHPQIFLNGGGSTSTQWWVESWPGDATTTASGYTRVTAQAGYMHGVPASTQGAQVVGVITPTSPKSGDVFRFKNDGTFSALWAGWEFRKKDTKGGVRVSNLSQSGKTLRELVFGFDGVHTSPTDVTDNTAGSSGMSHAIDMVRADLSILALSGTNDWDSFKNVNDFKVQLTALVNRQRATAMQGVNANSTPAAGDVVLVLNPEMDYAWYLANTGNTNNPSYESFLNACYQVADSLDVPIIDLAWRWQNHAQALALGIKRDQVHPSALGEFDYAEAVDAGLRALLGGHDRVYSPTNVTKYLKADFGAVGDGLTDDTAALASALAPSLGASPNAWPSGKYVDLVIEPGVYKVNPNQIVWDYSRCRIVSSTGAQIKVMTTTSTDVGIRIQISTPDSSGALALSKMSAGLDIVCGNATGRVGIGYKVGGVSTGTFADMTTSFRLASSMTIRGVYSSNFDIACQLGDNAFMLMFDACGFVGCNQGFVVPSGLTNSGERISFSNCNFTDQIASNTARTLQPQIYTGVHPYIDNQGNDATGLFFRNCSFDWLAQFLRTSTNSRTYFEQCWFEGPFDQMLTTTDSVWGTAAYGVIADHSPVMFNQCKFVIAAVGSGGQPTWTVPYLFKLDPWGKMTVRDSHAYFNTGTTSPLPVVGGIEAWASTPGLRLEGLIYDKPTDGQAFDDFLHRMPSRCTPQDGASRSWRSYSLDSLDTTGDTIGSATGVGKWSFGSTTSGTGTLSNSDLPPNAASLGIHNAMAFKDATQTAVVDKVLGFNPRYMTFDFWAKATGTSTQLYVIMQNLVSAGNNYTNEYAPPALTISTTWKRFHIVWDLNHSSSYGLFPATMYRWGFLGLPDGDHSALLAGMTMDAWA